MDGEERRITRYGSVQQCRSRQSAHPGGQYRAHPGRFYVLTAFSLFALVQSLGWLTFGAIPDESYRELGMTDNDVTLIAAYGTIAPILSSFPYMWFLDRFGLRVSVLSSSWLLAVGMVIRCFVPSTPGTKWISLIHLGHIAIGIAGPPVETTPARISSVWFPPKQRTFATSVMVMAQFTGIALGFIVIPYLTRHYDIHTMFYVTAEMAMFSALLVTIYFPAHPPTPPSPSAETERTTFLSSLKALMCNRAFIVLAISGGLVTGANSGFSSVFSIILNPTTTKFTDQVDVTSVSGFFHSNAWLGAATSLSGAIGGQLVGLIADRIQRRFKLLLLLLLMMATLLAFWFAVSVYGYTSNNAINLFTSLCLQYFFAFATYPLYVEAAVEVTYPVPEGSSAGVMNVLIHAATLLFQVIGMCHIFSNADPEKARVMVWVLGGLTGLAGLSLLLFQEKYQRLAVDTQSLKQRIQS